MIPIYIGKNCSLFTNQTHQSSNQRIELKTSNEIKYPNTASNIQVEQNTHAYQDKKLHGQCI